MIKRIFDIVFSFAGLVISAPFSIIIIVLIIAESRGGPFYIQKRVGKNNTEFNIIKFRTMYINSDKKSLLTTIANMSMITKSGKILRRFKIDEIPQLLNVLAGDMSIVGPRPEVRKYVNYYKPEQLKVLSVKPGLTDYASIKYFNESELLNKSSDPEKIYTEEIMQDKLKLNLEYIEKHNFLTDLKIICKTALKIFS